MRLNPFARKSRRVRKSRQDSTLITNEDGWLSSYARQSIIGISLLIFSFISILGFANAAGPAGEAIIIGLRSLFGWLAYAVPLVLIAEGAHLLWPQKIYLEKMRVIGLALLFIGLFGLLHVITATPDDAIQLAHEGRAGGYIGFLLSFPLSQALSRLAAGLIFLGSLLIGLILTFRVSPADIWDWFFNKMRSAPDETNENTASEVTSPASPRFRVNPVLRVADNPYGLPPNHGKKEEARIPQAANAAGRRYRPAILKLLHSSSSASVHSKDDENRIKNTIQRTLEHFGVNVEMGGANVGPTVTQYTLRPDEGTKLSHITTLQNDLALALAAHPIRIEAPIPNTSLVGIEIPNKNPSLVCLRDLLIAQEYRAVESSLAFPLGLNVSGKVLVESLDRLPHLLIAGATGSGKSVAIHSLLVSLLFRNTPETLRLILVDPKRVELPPYNGIPHLLTPVIVDTEKTVNALKWALEEMDVRYRLLEESGSRNLPSYNLNNPEEAKPYIVIVIDELADLMVKHSRDVEAPIVRLSQMARAVGIHLILATQRPSVNVLTGLIKANVPSRVAFSVASQVDSRTIIDMAGAEKLVGNGDMLYLSGDKARPVRIQGGFVSEEEVRDVVEVIKSSGEPDYNEAVVSTARGGGEMNSSLDSDGNDPLLDEAKRVVVQAGKASASLLQRRLRVGYARAARMLDILEERQVIGTAEGNKPRPVLMSHQEVEEETSLKNSVADNVDIELEDEEENQEDYRENQW